MPLCIYINRIKSKTVFVGIYVIMEPFLVLLEIKVDMNIWGQNLIIYKSKYISNITNNYLKLKSRSKIIYEFKI